jgi:hypothetical protein
VIAEVIGQKKEGEKKGPGSASPKNKKGTKQRTDGGWKNWAI